MGEVVGLHHKLADKLAREEFPNLEDAVKVAKGWSQEEVIEIAGRCFMGGVEYWELMVLLAYTRVRFADV